MGNDIVMRLQTRKIKKIEIDGPSEVDNRNVKLLQNIKTNQKMAGLAMWAIAF